MLTQKRIFLRATQTFFLLTVAAFLAGCGVDHSPVAQEEATITQSAGGTAYLTFSPQAVRRAAKPAAIPAEGVTVSGLVEPSGNSLEIIDQNGPGSSDDLKVTFRVPEKGVAEEVKISMTVYGNTLSDLLIAFEPGGLVFLIAAELQVNLGEDLIDIPLSELEAYHVSSKGAVEEATILSIDASGSIIKIVVSVPGFSCYGLGGDDELENCGF